MKLTIHYSTKIGTIKQAFNRMFPYLKIEFIKKPCVEDEADSWAGMVLHNMFVGEINHTLKEGSINISGDRKLLSVKQQFEQNFGLPVQVFRKEKKLWIATDLMEELTLAQQNEMGKDCCNQPLYSYMFDRHMDECQAY